MALNSQREYTRSESTITKVSGVLEKNVETRNKLILMKDRYSQYEELLAPAIGEYYQIRTLNVGSDTSGKSLTTYTYDDKSEYSSDILSKYFNHLSADDEIMQVDLDDSSIDQSSRWNGNYDDYLDYVSDLFSVKNTAFTFVNGVLANVSTQYALNEMSVGVIDNLQIIAALNGEVTTNPNSYKDSTVNLTNAIINGNSLITNSPDTRLGMITSQLYSQSLYNGAVFNSTRQRGNVSSGHAYITPSLASQYGNNLANLAKLSDLFYIDSTTGRIRDDLGSDIKIIDYSQLLINSGGNGQYSIITELLSEDNQLEVLSNSHIGDLSPNAVDNQRTIYTPPSKEYDTNETVSGYYKTNFRNSDLIAAKVEHKVYNDLNISEIEALSGTTTEFDQYDFVASEGGGDTQGVIVREGKLLDKTNRLFKDKKINTLVGKFYTGVKDSINNISENSTIDTVWHDKLWGRGKGRTLLTLEAETDGVPSNADANTYNPYCRAWTYHKQYAKYEDAIRPSNMYGSEATVYEDELLLSHRASFTADVITDGGKYLKENTVLQDNGLVKITPVSADGDNTDKLKDGLKKCMFSIENLAWKDDIAGKKMSADQTGPNGGRIMWFPPYDLDFQENVSVEWGNNAFIGRGEKVYTYSNTDRTAQLSFTLLIDHPSLLNSLGGGNIGQSGKANSIDTDILRFFAGCQPLKSYKTEEETNEKPKEDNKVKIVTEEGKTIKFAVFFPNNYSGNWQYKAGAVQNGNGTPTDGDWWKYLLFGKNTLYQSDVTTRGYEMVSNGISNTADTSNTAQANNYGTKGSGQWVTGTTANTDHAFYYRADFDLLQDTLNDKNYFDTVSFGLNYNIDVVPKVLGCDYTFAEVFYALYESELSSGETAILSAKTNSTNVSTLKSIFNSSTISKIVVAGGATEQDKKNTNKLIDRRASTVKNTFKTKLNLGDEVTNSSNSSVTIGSSTEKIDDVNTITTKRQRCAVVSITYNSPTTSNTGGQTDEQPSSDELTADGTTNGSGSSNSTSNKTNGSQTYVQVVSRGVTSYNPGSHRYGNEYEFFSKLEKTDPFIFKSIKDKYKYFDPAFHSMTPEGFNERLNFLHQCTRQGRTISASDVSNTSNTAPTAGNLAFGRMPVCVLRIGDFIYTRAVIQSLGIIYSNNGMQWDLNPEGAGVQPMFAKVNMSLILIGGQALNTPIPRLQNATTFNYYANTGVYDDRADRVKMEDGKLVFEQLYTPN